MLKFNFEGDRIAKEIMKRKAKKVHIQLPNGLKSYSFKILEELEKTGATLYLSAGHCYGGCDLAIREARDLECDLIVHYGHTSYVKNSTFPVIYVNARIILEKSTLKKIEKEFSSFNKIGVASTIQYLDMIDKVKKSLESLGRNIIIPPRVGKVEFPGQILGCEYLPLKKISNTVDCFLIIGSRFHSLGACLSLKKPIFLLDPLLDKIEPMEILRKKIVKQRYALISKAKSLNKFGILIGMKMGQFNNEAALRARELIKECGKKTALIAINEISTETINNFAEVDVFVNTACPRVAIDDVKRFNKPMLTLKECLVSIGKLDWENLLENGFF